MQEAELLAKYARGERNFQGLSLEGAHLEGSVLDGAMLDWANLKGAHLEGASLRRANLKRANLEAARLEGVNFQNANLKRALLNDADMQAAVLVDACLENAYLAAANLKWANLRGAILRRALLRRARLEEAHLEGASLEETVLVEANLDRCHLDGACLDKARVERASLHEASLRDCVLLGADLTHSELIDTNLEGAILVEANLDGATLTGANFTRVTFGRTYLIDVDLSPLCNLALTHRSASMVDFASVIKSINCLELKQFLREVGMTPVFVDDMVGCARSMSPLERLMATMSTYIVYVANDATAARNFHEALKDNGVTTFLYPVDAKLGDLSANALPQIIRNTDRAIVICSSAMLSKPQVVKELSDVQQRDSGLGKRSCLYPVAIDEHLFTDEFQQAYPGLAEVLAARVIGDFRDSTHDQALFDKSLPVLVDTIKSRKFELVAVSAS